MSNKPGSYIFFSVFDISYFVKLDFFSFFMEGRVSYVSYLCLQDSKQVLDLRPRCELMAQRSAVKGSVLVQNI